MEFYSELQELLCQDIGGRGLLAAVPELPLHALSRSLASARRVILLTGFPVDCKEQGVRGETDGPSGTANLAAALTARGCAVSVVTDAPSAALLEAALACRAPKAQLLVAPMQNTVRFARRVLAEVNPTHLVSLERPGKSADGHFHNMRGEIIDEMVADTDCFLPLAEAFGAETIAIGDGGNELGMGSYHQIIEEMVPHGKEICAFYPADYALVTGVSNWWGWGIAAMLSQQAGHSLLPTEAEETALLRAVLAAGAVDGCTKQPTLSVDALPLETHLALLRRLHELTEKALRPCAKGA